MDASRSQINRKYAAHLAALGFAIDTPHEVIDSKLREVMGPKRFDRYFKHLISADSTQHYRIFASAEEANLYASHFAEDAIVAFGCIYRAARRRLSSGAVVLDLGCWTGALASFVAKHRPNCHIFGVDSLARLIESNRITHSLPNLDFITWDYREKPPATVTDADVLVSSFGIEVTPNLSLHYSLDPSSLMESPAFIEYATALFPYFSNWRRASKAGGRLHAALRVNGFVNGLAMFYASSRAGWKFEPTESCGCDVGGRHFWMISFTAGRLHSVDESELLEWWAAKYRLEDEGGIHDAAALIEYRALRDKKVLDRREFSLPAGSPPGHTGLVEYGNSRYSSYEFVQLTTGISRLRWLTESEVMRRIGNKPPNRRSEASTNVGRAYYRRRITPRPRKI